MLCGSAVPKHWPWSPKQPTCAITAEVPWAQAQPRADTAMLPRGPKWKCSAPATGLAFQHTDTVLDGDVDFYLSGFFQLTHSISYRQQQKKNPDLPPCPVVPMHLGDWVSLGGKKICEQVINNYITKKTGKGQIRVAEGSLIPASPGY